MLTNTQPFNPKLILAATRIFTIDFSGSGLSGTYYNGPLNDGVGATFTVVPGVLIIDGITINLADSVILTSQTLGYENGLYVCTQAGASGVSAILKRRADLHCIEQFQLGKFSPIYGGPLAGSFAVLAEPLPLAIGAPLVAGTNDINFV